MEFIPVLDYLNIYYVLSVVLTTYIASKSDLLYKTIGKTGLLKVINFGYKQFITVFVSVLFAVLFFYLNFDKVNSEYIQTMIISFAASNLFYSYIIKTITTAFKQRAETTEVIDIGRGTKDTQDFFDGKDDGDIKVISLHPSEQIEKILNG